MSKNLPHQLVVRVSDEMKLPGYRGQVIPMRETTSGVAV